LRRNAIHIVVLLTAFLLLPVCAGAQTQLDEYSGVANASCPGGARGNFYTEKMGNHWVYCDPLGHPYIHRGVYYIGYGDSHTESPFIPESWDAATANKYPGAEAQNNMAVERIRSWGFNGIGPGGYRMAYAFDPYGPIVAPPTPFINYFGANAHVTCEQRSSCKNVWYLYDTTIGTGSNLHLTDVYDPNYAGVVMNAYANDCNLSSNGSSACYSPSTASNTPYFIGGVAGDSDYFTGFEAGVDFQTSPAGKSFDHAGWIILNSAPRQTMNPFSTPVTPFTDTANHSKAQLAQFLQNEYGTIQALNTAWGSSYTTFGSSGSQVTGEVTGVSGSGGSVNFTLKHANLDRLSVLIMIGGTVAGGDDGNSNLIGSGISSGTINYATGQVNLTSGLTGSVTVSYYYNGFRNGGTGLLDNYSPRLSTSPYTSTSPDSWGTQAYKSDLDNFLQGYAFTFLSAMQKAFKTYAPNNLFLGPSSLGSWSAPARCPVLRAAGQVLDVGQMSFDGSQAQLDFIAKCFGDKPYQNWYSVSANFDSDAAPFLKTQPLQAPIYKDYPTQSARAAQFQIDMTDYWNMCSTATNSCPWVGYDWWAYLSYGFTEQSNFGLVSWRDNAYDGNEDVSAARTCSSPLSGYNCGGEWSTYGNFLGPVTSINASLDANLVSLANGPITPTAAVLTQPTPGGTLPGASASFAWTASGSPGTNYRLYLGSVAGGSDLYNSGQVTTTSANVTALPTNGLPIYATLGTLINGTWRSNSYTYSASAAPARSVLLSPATGSTLTSASATFTWSAGSAVTLYQFTLGSTLGGNDLYSSGQVTATSVNVTGLPTTGSPIYATLSSLVNGGWLSNTYTYMASVPATPAVLLAPVPGSTLTATSATFNWSAGTAVTQYRLDLGTTGVGSTNLFTTGTTTATLANATALPVNGLPIYARLWSYMNGSWASADYTYTASKVIQAAAAPAFATPSGTYSLAQAVTISDATPGAAIYYTTNGTTPTASANKYARAIAVSSTETIKAIAVASGYSQSAVATASYTISPQLTAPKFSVASGTYALPQKVTISSSTALVTIYYTTNGTTPTTASTKYTSAGIIVSATETINAIAIAPGCTQSAVASATYTIPAGALKVEKIGSFQNVPLNVGAL
jgi:hypothetical protein